MVFGLGARVWDLSILFFGLGWGLTVVVFGLGF